MHQTVLAGHITSTSDAVRTTLDSLTQHFVTMGSDAVLAAQQAQSVLYGMVGRESAMLAYIDDFRMMGYSVLFMIPLLFLMKKAKPHKGPVH